MSIEKTLEERGGRYGSYADNAAIMQELKRTMRKGRSWEDAPDTVKEALECIALKIGRIVNGDPLYDDSWRDLIGYSTLVLDEITQMNDQKPVRARTLDPAPNSAVTGPAADPNTWLTGQSEPGAIITIGGPAPAKRQRTIDPMPAGPPGTETTDASHAAEPVVPRRSMTGIHLTTDHVGMFFRLAGENQSPVRLQANDGPEYDRFPFKAHNRRYTQYGHVAAADGDPIHDIVAFHPH